MAEPKFIIMVHTLSDNECSYNFFSIQKLIFAFQRKHNFDIKSFLFK